jgi:hypothetical protein
MGKHRSRIRLLSVITAMALVIGISAGSAQAAPSYRGSSRAVASNIVSRAAQAQAASSQLAPCTKPLFGSDKDCESTSPTVDRWVQYTGSAVNSCTYTAHVDWGDGTSSSRTFVDPTPSATNLIASHTYGAETQTTTYTETVTSTVDAGTCNPIATTVFHFTHLLSAVAPWYKEYPFSNPCFLSLSADILLSGAELILVAKFGTGLIPVFVLVDGLFIAFDEPFSCVEQPTTEYSALPSAFAYGARHPGKPFKPSGKVPPRPQITGIYGYQKGSLDYFSLTYADPGQDAKGFGFVGVNGAGWALENHPFSNPSYGIVGKDRIDYPFNLECGTAQQYNSWVEAWIYDSHGQRSNPVEIYLSCTT